MLNAKFLNQIPRSICFIPDIFNIVPLVECMHGWTKVRTKVYDSLQAQMYYKKKELGMGCTAKDRNLAAREKE